MLHCGLFNLEQLWAKKKKDMKLLKKKIEHNYISAD